jgi:hypothetical protein
VYARCGSRTPLVLPPPRVPALNPAPTSRRVCHLALQSASATSWPADRKTTRGAAATEATLIYRTRERPDVLAKASATAPATPAEFVVKAGTKIPLSLVNSLNTKVTAEGDRVYLETAFPIVQDGRIVVPKGSYVAGTVTEVKRAGKLKGKAELFLRFDSLTLPNGVTREFRSRPDSADGNDVDRQRRQDPRPGWRARCSRAALPSPANLPCDNHAIIRNQWRLRTVQYNRAHAYRLDRFNRCVVGCSRHGHSSSSGSSAALAFRGHQRRGSE